MKRFLSLLLLLPLFALPARGQEEKDLRQEVKELRDEVRELRAAIEALKQERAGTATTATPAPVATVDATTVAPTTAATPEPARNTTLWGYGELNLNRPRRDASAAQADVRRAVLGFGHAFSDRTRVVGELEWEHAIVSADDEGESEVEQLMIEHQFNSRVGARAGLMLIPLGLLNERHEPTNYYGVERNLVETAIIPSTWREGGVSLFGNSESGLNWTAGLTTGFDLSKWDAASEEGRESPLGSIHQELQLAKAHDPSLFAAANWQGMPGLVVGSGVFTGKIGQGQDFAGRNSRLILSEAHARWQPGAFDVSALYARGNISNTKDLNLTFVGNPTPVPKSFWGAYVQGAWRAWQHGSTTVAPFLRFEEFNTASSYERVPAGLGVAPAETERVWTGGLNYWLTRDLVFKADYQKFKLDSGRDRFDLGIGYQF